MPVDIQAAFSEKERPRNGLEAIVKALVEDPLTPRYAIVVFHSPTYRVNNEEGGAIIPKVKLDGIEPMLSMKAETDAKKLYEAEYKARNGNLPQDPLPLDEDEADAPAGTDG